MPLIVPFCQKASAALTTIQITVDMKEGYVLWVMGFIMLLQERRQALTEQALNQLNIVAHFWKAAAQAKVALKATINDSAIAFLHVSCQSKVCVIASG